MKSRRFFPLGLLLGLCPVVLISGCGGGSGKSTAPTTASSGTGRAVLEIRWPAPAATRLIPSASQSLHVLIVRGETTIAAKVVPRPSSGSSIVTFENLPVDTLSVRAAAYATTNASGTAQAYGVAPATVKARETTVFNLTLASTIDRLELDTNPVQLPEKTTKTVAVTARDASGAIVLTTPGQLQWSGSDTTFGVDSTGLVTALAAGTGILTVTDTESGKVATAAVIVTPISVAVSPDTATVSVRKTVQLTASVTGTDNTNVSWRVEENGPASQVGSVSATGLYTAPNAAGTFHVIAASTLNPARTARVEIIVQSGSAGGIIK